MTTNTTANPWVQLSDICAQLNTTPDKLGAASRHHYLFAGLNTIEFYWDGAVIQKRWQYTKARYRVISNPHSL